MNILFTTPILEHPPAGGSQLRIENSIKALSRISNLHIVSRMGRSQIGGKDAEAFYSRIARNFSYAPSCRSHSPNRYLRKMQRIAGTLSGRDIKQDAAFLLEYIDTHGINIIWLGYGNISFPLVRALRKARPSLRLVCDTDSIWSRFVLRELPYVKNPLRRILVTWRGHRKEVEERTWVELCDVTTGVSEVDCDYYRSLAADRNKIKQFSNVIDLSSYVTSPPPPNGFRKPCIYLAGKFGHANSPMDRAARWMLDEVMPIVRRTLPDIHFYIVGSGSDLTLGHETNDKVTVTGKLPSVLPYLCNADVSLVPLQFESGTRFKILEAAACSIPIVSTTLGAEGLPARHGEQLLIADTKEDFAAAIIRLIRDRTYAMQLAQSCKQLVHKEFSIDTLEREARHILDYLNP